MTRPRSVPVGDSPARQWPQKSVGVASSASVPNVRPPTGDRALSDSQVLRVLVRRRADATTSDREAIGADVAVLAPEDTSTRLILREAVALNAPVSFAVQLQWSVHPIDVKSVPRQSIFASYTLYAAEGRRGGRAWFCLRLGFFSDALSAKQVALYLRAHFASAAVVPVSPQEQRHARGIGT